MKTANGTRGHCIQRPGNNHHTKDNGCRLKCFDKKIIFAQPINNATTHSTRQQET